MTKMIRTARGSVVDWDLLKIQAAVASRVAEPVTITTEPAKYPTTNPSDLADRRARRARMEAAAAALSSVKPPKNEELDENGWPA